MTYEEYFEQLHAYEKSIKQINKLRKILKDKYKELVRDDFERVHDLVYGEKVNVIEDNGHSVICFYGGFHMLNGKDPTPVFNLPLEVSGKMSSSKHYIPNTINKIIKL